VLQAERNLRDFLCWAVDEFATPEARAALPNLMVELAGDRQLQEKIRDGLILPERNRAREALRRGIKRGELRPDLDTDLVLDALIGAIFCRSLIMDQTVNGGLVDNLVEIVLSGARSRHCSTS
jgi:hypothetical protein